MMIFKSKAGDKITVVIGNTETTLSIAEWSALIARPTIRTT